MTRRPSEPSMRSQLVRPFLAQVRAAGGDVGALLERFGLPASAASEPEVSLPLTTLGELLAAAATAAHDPFLGLHIASRLDRGTYGVVEFACRSAPDFREAMQRIVRYVSLLNEIIVVSFEERGGLGVIEQRVPGWPQCVGRQANEFFVAMLLHQAGQLSARPCVPERVWLAHPAPAGAAELARVYGTKRIEFEAGMNAVALPEAVLARPLATADPRLLEILDKHAEGQLRSRAAPNRFLGQVRHLVQERLVGAVPTLAETGRAFGMSSRTFQRRLADEGTSWQGLLDAVRQEVARHKIKDRAVPLGEIAYLCGYAELSAFLRAFKRWTGKSPSEMRG